MKVPSWLVPVLVQLLSCAGLGSAAGDKAPPLTLGFTLTNANAGVDPAGATAAGYQPHFGDFSLGLDFFVKVADLEVRVPIMPLHLLGKKSWNVYNTSNIDIVRRDEARASALEAAEDERLQDLDAQRRMQILRGETPTLLAIEDVSLPLDPNVPLPKGSGFNRDGSGREKKKRKKAGENDTDFEMRVVREEQDQTREIGNQLVSRKEGEAPLTDHNGHIDLFPRPKPVSHKAEKNAEAEKELARKKKEYEDQYTMRFDNAAGFKVGLAGPWYSQPGNRTAGMDDQPGKDVWGNEDPRRKDRQVKRIVESDPLAMMKAGARGVREVKKERERWREEKEKEVRALEDAESRDRRKRRREEVDDDEDDLEGFRLDGGGEGREEKPRGGKESEKERERRHRRKRKEERRSEHREEGRHRHRHRDRERHRD